jgi:outer membrane protein assembly factor BamB
MNPLRSLLLWLSFGLLSACAGTREARKYEASFPGHQWTQRLTAPGTENFRVLTTDASGNLIMVGQTLLSGEDRDALVARYDPRQDTLWVRHFGLSGIEGIADVTTDANGNIFVVGSTHGDTTSQTDSDAFVAKYDPHGNQQWTRRFGTPKSDQGAATATDLEGNVYVAGTTRDMSMFTSDSDFSLAKFDTRGTLLWTQQLGISALGSPIERLSTDAHGNVYLLGYTTEGAHSEGPRGLVAFVARFDASGVKQWQRVVHRSSPREMAIATGFAVDARGNSYVMLELEAERQPSKAGDIHLEDILLMRLGPDGSQQWRRRLGTPRDERGMALSVSSDGTVTVIGRTSGPIIAEPRREKDHPMYGGRLVHLGVSTLFTASYDETGALQKVRQFGTSARHFGYHFVTAWNGCVYVLGPVTVEDNDDDPMTQPPTDDYLMSQLCEAPASEPDPARQPAPVEQVDTAETLH